MRNFSKKINVSSLAVKMSAAVVVLAFAGVSYIGISATGEAATLKKQLGESQTQKVSQELVLQGELTLVRAELETLRADTEAQQGAVIALATCQHDLEAIKALPKKKIVEAK